MNGFKLGDRVAEPDSYYVATVVSTWGDTIVLVEYDAHGRYLTEKREDLKSVSRVQLAQPYQEFHNACGMQKDGVPTVIPPSPYK